MKAYSLDLRQKIIDAYLNKENSIRQLADRFKVAKSFVQKLVKRYQQEGILAPRPHNGGCTPKLTNEQVMILVGLVESDNDATLEELCDRLLDRTGILVSSSTICRTLQKLQLTRKKKSLHATAAESERVQRLRVEYREIIQNICPKDLVFIDETGVNLKMVRLYARALFGHRAYGERPYKKGGNVTLIGAIAKTGLIGAMTVDGGTTGNVFQVFVEQVLVPSLWPGACVVMDNLSAHKVKGIQSTIEAAGARVIYLPPYSPDFNPIENCWSKIKEYLRSLAVRTREALDTAISEAIEQVTLKDINNWFTHCCYCTSAN